MKAAYLKAYRQFEVRDVELRPIHDDEVLLRVQACGYCGHDNILASYHAKEWEPFGHEIAGEVIELGQRVTNVQLGDKVCVETSTFDPLLACSRNGRPEQDITPMGASFMEMDKGQRNAMGFAEYVIVPAVLCVNTDGLSAEEAALIEPLGVAFDLVLTVDIQLGDDVLIFGLGPIGLMALQLAKYRGARKIYVAEHSYQKERIKLARYFGADEVICTDKLSLNDYQFEKAGVDKILLSAPPKFIGEACEIMNPGGILAFLGISYNEEMASFNSNTVHLNKLQIRASNAIPALYFPLVIDLVKAGKVNLKSLVSHRFNLTTLSDDMASYYRENEKAVKAVLIND